ncbi:four helix bundle protein [Granulicella sp. L46]|jgi:four helix bundle protein|uniref:four helix bundle protein n=1 Tax=Granulicella sp. L46 TaxID=1641865 RepID=UPI00131D2BED|nr:four helix bundle protein [Granulicella sp. L46]
MVAADINSSYRNSVAWQKGMQLAALIYKVTKSFPMDERFGLTNQLRRAAVSIPSNIAEGKGRLTTGEFIQFLGIARGSTLEVQTQLELASMLGFGDRRGLIEAESLALEELKILNASLATLRAKVTARRLR